MYDLIRDLTRPFSLLFLCLLVATALLWRRGAGRRTKIAATVFVVVLALACCQTVSYFLMGMFEWGYPPWDGTPTPADTIVVLAGGYRVYDASGNRAELEPDSLFRSLHAAKLYKQASGCRLVVSGGKVHPKAPGPTLAEAMAEVLAQLGVKPADMLLENASRTTYENALYTHEILKAHNVRRIILVTDARHMFRSERCFRALGIDVIPAPCNHHATWFQWSASRLVPTPEGAKGTEGAVHEAMGVVWYCLHGRI